MTSLQRVLVTSNTPVLYEKYNEEWNNKIKEGETNPFLGQVADAGQFWMVFVPFEDLLKTFQSDTDVVLLLGNDKKHDVYNDNMLKNLPEKKGTARPPTQYMQFYPLFAQENGNPSLFGRIVVATANEMRVVYDKKTGEQEKAGFPTHLGFIFGLGNVNLTPEHCDYCNKYVYIYTESVETLVAKLKARFLDRKDIIPGYKKPAASRSAAAAAAAANDDDDDDDPKDNPSTKRSKDDRPAIETPSLQAGASRQDTDDSDVVNLSEQDPAKSLAEKAKIDKWVESTYSLKKGQAGEPSEESKIRVTHNFTTEVGLPADLDRVKVSSKYPVFKHLSNKTNLKWVSVQTKPSAAPAAAPAAAPVPAPLKPAAMPAASAAPAVIPQAAAPAVGAAAPPVAAVVPTSVLHPEPSQSSPGQQTQPAINAFPEKIQASSVPASTTPSTAVPSTLPESHSSDVVNLSEQDPAKSLAEKAKIDKWVESTYSLKKGQAGEPSEESKIRVTHNFTTEVGLPADLDRVKVSSKYPVFKHLSNKTNLKWVSVQTNPPAAPAAAPAAAPVPAPPKPAASAAPTPTQIPKSPSLPGPMSTSHGLAPHQQTGSQSGAAAARPAVLPTGVTQQTGNQPGAAAAQPSNLPVQTGTLSAAAAPASTPPPQQPVPLPSTKTYAEPVTKYPIKLMDTVKQSQASAAFLPLLSDDERKQLHYAVASMQNPAEKISDVFYEIPTVYGVTITKPKGFTPNVDKVLRLAKSTSPPAFPTESTLKWALQPLARFMPSLVARMCQEHTLGAVRDYFRRQTVRVVVGGTEREWKTIRLHDFFIVVLCVREAPALTTVLNAQAWLLWNPPAASNGGAGGTSATSSNATVNGSPPVQGVPPPTAAAPLATPPQQQQLFIPPASNVAAVNSAASAIGGNASPATGGSTPSQQQPVATAPLKRGTIPAEKLPSFVDLLNGQSPMSIQTPALPAPIVGASGSAALANDGNAPPAAGSRSFFQQRLDAQRLRQSADTSSSSPPSKRHTFLAQKPPAVQPPPMSTQTPPDLSASGVQDQSKPADASPTRRPSDKIVTFQLADAGSTPAADAGPTPAAAAPVQPESASAATPMREGYQDEMEDVSDARPWRREDFTDSNGVPMATPDATQNLGVNNESRRKSNGAELFKNIDQIHPPLFNAPSLPGDAPANVNADQSADVIPADQVQRPFQLPPYETFSSENADSASGVAGQPAEHQPLPPLTDTLWFQTKSDTSASEDLSSRPYVDVSAGQQADPVLPPRPTPPQQQLGINPVNLDVSDLDELNVSLGGLGLEELEPTKVPLQPASDVVPPPEIPVSSNPAAQMAADVPTGTDVDAKIDLLATKVIKTLVPEFKELAQKNAKEFDQWAKKKFGASFEGNNVRLMPPKEFYVDEDVIFNFTFERVADIATEQGINLDVFVKYREIQARTKLSADEKVGLRNKFIDEESVYSSKRDDFNSKILTKYTLHRLEKLDQTNYKLSTPAEVVANIIYADTGVTVPDRMKFLGAFKNTMPIQEVADLAKEFGFIVSLDSATGEFSVKMDNLQTLQTKWAHKESVLQFLKSIPSNQADLQQLIEKCKTAKDRLEIVNDVKRPVGMAPLTEQDKKLVLANIQNVDKLMDAEFLSHYHTEFKNLLDADPADSGIDDNQYLVPTLNTVLVRGATQALALNSDAFRKFQTLYNKPTEFEFLSDKKMLDEIPYYNIKIRGHNVCYISTENAGKVRTRIGELDVSAGSMLNVIDTITNTVSESEQQVEYTQAVIDTLLRKDPFKHEVIQTATMNKAVKDASEITQFTGHTNIVGIEGSTHDKVDKLLTALKTLQTRVNQEHSRMAALLDKVRTVVNMDAHCREVLATNDATKLIKFLSMDAELRKPVAKKLPALTKTALFTSIQSAIETVLKSVAPNVNIKDTRQRLANMVNSLEFLLVGQKDSLLKLIQQTDGTSGNLSDVEDPLDPVTLGEYAIRLRHYLDGVTEGRVLTAEEAEHLLQYINEERTERITLDEWMQSTPPDEVDTIVHGALKSYKKTLKNSDKEEEEVSDDGDDDEQDAAAASDNGSAPSQPPPTDQGGADAAAGSDAGPAPSQPTPKQGGTAAEGGSDAGAVYGQLETSLRTYLGVDTSSTLNFTWNEVQTLVKRLELGQQGVKLDGSLAKQLLGKWYNDNKGTPDVEIALSAALDPNRPPSTQTVTMSPASQQSTGNSPSASTPSQSLPDRGQSQGPSSPAGSTASTQGPAAGRDVENTAEIPTKAMPKGYKRDPVSAASPWKTGQLALYYNSTAKEYQIYEIADDGGKSNLNLGSMKVGDKSKVSKCAIKNAWRVVKKTK